MPYLTRASIALSRVTLVPKVYTMDPLLIFPQKRHVLFCVVHIEGTSFKQDSVPLHLLLPVK